MGPQYRRCCWYFLVGSWLIVGVAAALRKQFGLPLTDRSFLIGLLGLPAFSLLLLLTAESWRMRIDSQGISCRRWWFWSTWPWAAFRTGRISRNLLNGRYVYLHSDRPWGDRRLHVDWLADGDRTFVDKLCRQAILSATQPPTPVAEIVSERRGRFTSAGICLSFPWNTSPPSLTPWSEVEKLQLTWRLRDDGLSCRVELRPKGSKPQRAVLRELNAITPTGEKCRLTNEVVQVEQFIAPRLESERFASYQVFDSPRSPAEAAYQVEHFQRRLGDVRWYSVVFNILALIAAAGLFVGKVVPGVRILWAEPFLAWQWKVAIATSGLLLVVAGPLLTAALAWLAFSEINKKVTRAKSMLGDSTLPRDKTL